MQSAEAEALFVSAANPTGDACPSPVRYFGRGRRASAGQSQAVVPAYSAGRGPRAAGGAAAGQSHAFGYRGWRLILGLFAADAILVPLEGFRIAWSGAAGPAVVTLVLAAAALAWRRRKGGENAAVLFDTIAQVIAGFALCGILSYLGVAGNRPLVDPELAEIDAALGFNWAHFVGWVQAHPDLDRVLAIAYHSSVPQMIAIALLLFPRQPERVRELGSTMMIALVFTILISATLPAESAYPFFRATHPEIRPEIWVSDLFALRDGSLRTIDLAHMDGLISCPSYHTILSLLFICVLRGRRLLFPIALLLNAAVIASTLTAGGHYLVDLAAGAAVTLGTLALYHLVLLGNSRWSGDAIAVLEPVTSAGVRDA